MSTILEMQAVERMLRDANEADIDATVIVWTFACAMYKGKDITERIQLAAESTRRDWDLIP